MGETKKTDMAPTKVPSGYCSLCCHEHLGDTRKVSILGRKHPLHLTPLPWLPTKGPLVRLSLSEPRTSRQLWLLLPGPVALSAVLGFGPVPHSTPYLSSSKGSQLLACWAQGLPETYLCGWKKAPLGSDYLDCMPVLEPEACFCPRSSGLTDRRGRWAGCLPEQLDVRVAVLDLVVPDAPGALLPTDDPHLLDLTCIQT